MTDVTTSADLPAASARPADNRVEAFKNAFRQHPTGVAIIAAQSENGPVGLTASSVASVGLDPLALVFSVTRAAGSAGALLDAETFVVHLLTDRHADVALSFARSGAPRFTPEQGWSRLDTGEPHLADALAAFRCRPLHAVPVGDSTLVVAEVLDVLDGRDGAPLVYHDRRFYSLDVSGSEL
ncbi:hypothetical protein GCM10027416_28910 [Okibacterium endophyticum]